MSRRSSFARGRGGAGGREAPPQLSVPFGDLDHRSQKEQDADFGPIKAIGLMLLVLFVGTIGFTIGRGIWAVITTP